MTLRRLLLTAAIAQVILLATCLGPARAAPPELVQIGTFEFPVHLTSPPGDSRRILVVERAGSVRLLVDGVSRAEPFLTVHTVAVRG